MLLVGIARQCGNVKTVYDSLNRLHIFIYKHICILGMCTQVQHPYKNFVHGGGGGV